jgi:hypothetical protein
MTIFI